MRDIDGLVASSDSRVNRQNDVSDVQGELGLLQPNPVSAPERQSRLLNAWQAMKTAIWLLAEAFGLAAGASMCLSGFYAIITSDLAWLHLGEALGLCLNPTIIRIVSAVVCVCGWNVADSRWHAVACWVNFRRLKAMGED